MYREMKILALSIIKGHEFEMRRRVFQAKQLKSLGYGNKPNYLDELTTLDGDKLFEYDVLGTHASLPLTSAFH